MKKQLKYLISILIAFLFPLFVNAGSISNINMDIYIDNLGTAHVTETWTATINEGTELYKPFYGIDNAKITNFSVSENGYNYTYNDYWNVNGTFNEKSNKNGINYVSEGIELCWGITNYGSHNYVLKYDIEGFVATNSDSDMIYWRLIADKMNPTPENVNIKIHADNYFSDDVPVWGYGKYGATAYVYDGVIEMNSESSLNSDEYMTILVKFDKGTFDTYNEVPYDFNHYLEMSKEGAKEYKEKKPSFILDFLYTIIHIILEFLPILFFAFIFSLFVKSSNDKIGSKKFDFGKDGRKLPKEIPNFRDIPCNKDIHEAYWISTAYGLNNKKEDFLGAILLKWLKQKKIELIKDSKGTFIKKEECKIVLKEEIELDNEVELELYNMMYKASKDGILEPYEFNRWSSNNYDKLFNWFNKSLDFESDKLINDKRIVLNEKNKKTNLVTPYIKEEAVKLKGLKNFLIEFSRIDKKEAIEVNIWDEYLMYAQIFGIAKKVAKQFKKLYPEVVNTDLGYGIDDIIFINMISTDSIQNASSSKSRAESYSSGGGGFSSGGGGGGSFGGSSSGGGIR